ncbi:hypothetical protein LEP1GSC193_3134 [Leptospira alstonii serovar Pingchang str. 80-412]|uniref:Uncharacterized protein n=2 Tax=Leptospira alstonii TaxID=28452 RepID=M6CKG9_9LEPT|nr:hypothetical protein LEP1GSC194_0089 [Leptospira alstonii serovar Sichuan str. 79601]EQA80774.1 hypothetical protein LEP1GSC193_3134 [Leptospira alstonii serovar Pingchang str. 80-412]
MKKFALTENGSEGDLERLKNSKFILDKMAPLLGLKTVG